MFISVSNPLDAELQTLFHGVPICQTKGLKNIIIEGDCLILVENLRTMDNIQWDYMTTWKKLLEAHGYFDKWDISLCRRSQNGVADALAKHVPPIFVVFSMYLPYEMFMAYAKEKQDPEIKYRPSTPDALNGDSNRSNPGVDPTFYHFI